MDIRHFDIFPKYLTDDLTLFSKFEEQRYGSKLDAFTSATRQPSYSFELEKAPAQVPAAVLESWKEFWKDAKSWPQHFTQLGHNYGYKTVSEVTLEYRHRLAKAFPDIPQLELRVPWLTLPEEWQLRSYQAVQGPFAPVYAQLRNELPLRYFRPTTVDGAFIIQYLRPKYGAGPEGIQKLNLRWGTNYTSLYEVRLSSLPPDQPAMREDWWKFVQQTLSVRFIRFSPSLLPGYQKALQAQYHDIQSLNAVYQTTFQSWADVTFPKHDGIPAAFSDLEIFLQNLKTLSGISLDGPEFRWSDFLRKKYNHDLNALNHAFQSHFDSFESIPMPIFAADWNIMLENRAAITWDFLTRNYRIVWDYLSVQGHAIQNTLIFCFLNVLTALIVNPLAAYALSRFQPRWGYKILFLLMATMAFPGEVTQIPSFLMLREFGLLNTFAALIIPAAANGYSIFLLKGFFDSLPKELYESATIDGAGELRIFREIAMPLSTPILAVIALGAFISAYSAFMFALLVCQKQSMWTLMVHIYQLQQFYETPVIFAALVLAAIPTLLIFVFCQNIIMRGIVIPVEK